MYVAIIFIKLHANVHSMWYPGNQKIMCMKYSSSGKCFCFFSHVPNRRRTLYTIIHTMCRCKARRAKILIKKPNPWQNNQSEFLARLLVITRNRSKSQIKYLYIRHIVSIQRLDNIYWTRFVLLLSLLSKTSKYGAGFIIVIFIFVPWTWRHELLTVRVHSCLRTVFVQPKYVYVLVQSMHPNTFLQNADSLMKYIIAEWNTSSI